MSQSPSKRLAVRRGSVSAPDPLGKNAVLNHDSNRSSSSTLTIVRVVDPSSPAGTVVASPILPDSPSSPTHGRRSLRRHGSTSGSADNRLSFAFSTFSPSSPPQPSSPLSSSGSQNYPSKTGGCSSPSSPRLGRSSPQFGRRHSASGGSTFIKPNLTPEQLVDLARQSSAPCYVPGLTGTPHLSNQINPDATRAGYSSPATFTLLPVDVYLPFIDRAAETSHLLSIPPTKKLFSLLAQTFPTQAHEEIQDPFTIDPARWTFNTLCRWLTEVDRPSVNDTVWVRQARKCVMAHSELIWERLKGALGVPPELEVEDLETSHHVSASNLSFVEPILATSLSNRPPPTPGVTNPPPLSLPAGLTHPASKSQDQALQDIVEDLEEEEELGTNTGDGDCIKSDEDSKAQIHGLRVCTSPVEMALYSSRPPHLQRRKALPGLRT